jgi:hypothetical protein
MEKGEGGKTGSFQDRRAQGNGVDFDMNSGNVTPHLSMHRDPCLPMPFFSIMPVSNVVV